MLSVGSNADHGQKDVRVRSSEMTRSTRCAMSVSMSASIHRVVEVAVHLRADPRDLGLGDPGIRSKRLDEIVDLPGGHPMDVGLHDNGVEGLVDPPPAFQNRGKVGTFC